MKLVLVSMTLTNNWGTELMHLMTNGGSNFKINKNRNHNNGLFSQNLNIPTKNRSAIPI